MKTKYPIHDTSEEVNHGQVVPEYFTHNPIPKGTILNIFYKNMKILIKINMNFYTDPNLSVIEILEVNHEVTK